MSVYRVENSRGSSLVVEASSLATAVKLFDAEARKWAREDGWPVASCIASKAERIDTDHVLRRRR